MKRRKETTTTIIEVSPRTAIQATNVNSKKQTEKQKVSPRTSFLWCIIIRIRRSHVCFMLRELRQQVSSVVSCQVYLWQGITLILTCRAGSFLAVVPYTLDNANGFLPPLEHRPLKWLGHLSILSGLSARKELTGQLAVGCIRSVFVLGSFDTPGLSLKKG